MNARPNAKAAGVPIPPTPPTNFPSKEYALIKRMQNRLPPVSAQSPYELTIGDDAAVRLNKTAGERLIITADVSVENVHFSVDTMTFEEIGYRAMVSNLSDCAAMGALPDSAVAQIVFPKNSRHTVISNICNSNDISNNNTIPNNHADGNVINNTVVNKKFPRSIGDSIEQIYTGFARACDKWDFPVVGGDLSGGGEWTIAITLIGSIPPGSRALKRTGIADGDALWVTGAPGESAAGLACLRRWGRGGVPQQYRQFVDAHISPSPRIAEGRAFAACAHVRSMMDLSDGLSKDAATLCFDNNLGFIFDHGLSPSPNMANLAADLSHDWRDWFYHGGEEYELLVACDPSFDLRATVNKDVDLIKLGHFTSTRPGLFIQCDYGGVKMEKLPSKSWDHVL